MHAFTLTAVALLSSLAAAQIPGLPSCAATCVGTSFGDCGSLDVKCICSSTTLLSGLSCCVSTACNEDDQKKTLEFANSLCSGQGVTNLPTAATCEGSASSTAAPESSSSSMMEMSSSMSSASESAASSASSAMSSGSSMASSMSSSMAEASASSTSAAGETGSVTSSSTTEQSTGGAESLRSGVVGAVGLVLAGVVAAL